MVNEFFPLSIRPTMFQILQALQFLPDKKQFKADTNSFSPFTHYRIFTHPIKSNFKHSFKFSKKLILSIF